MAWDELSVTVEFQTASAERSSSLVCAGVAAALVTSSERLDLSLWSKRKAYAQKP